LVSSAIPSWDRETILLFNNSEIRSRIYCAEGLAILGSGAIGAEKCGYMLIAKAIGILKMRLGATNLRVRSLNVTGLM
jgi:hypothetical protein